MNIDVAIYIVYMYIYTIIYVAIHIDVLYVSDCIIIRMIDRLMSRLIR